MKARRNLSGSAALLLCAMLVPCYAPAQERQGEPVLRPPAEVPGITPEVLSRAEVPGALGKTALLTRVTYQPGARNRKHYHTSQVVFYILEGAMTVQENGREPVTLKPGDSLLVKPGTVHAHWNASTSEKLIFTEFALVDAGQQSTVPMEQ